MSPEIDGSRTSPNQENISHSPKVLHRWETGTPEAFEQRGQVAVQMNLSTERKDDVDVHLHLAILYDPH